jgi:hypothetical protein
VVVEPRSVGIALADGLCELGGGITLAEGLRDWGWRAVSLLNYTLAFALQLRKSTENLSQGGRVVCCRGTCPISYGRRPFHIILS